MLRHRFQLSMPSLILNRQRFASDAAICKEIAMPETPMPTTAMPQSMYSSILVVLGAERKVTAALHRGVELARRTGAKLTICQFVHYPMIEIARERLDAELATMAQRDYLRQMGSWLYEEVGELVKRGIKADCDIVWAPILHEAVLGKILEIGPDLVIKDADYDHGRLTHSDRDPIDTRMLRLCPAPLMLVRPESPLIPKRLLAAVDVLSLETSAGVLNQRIMDQGKSLSSACEADLEVASAYSWVPLGGEDYGASMAAVFDSIDTAHREASADFAKRFEIPEARMHRLLGVASDVIRKSASEMKTSLVIIGSAYRSGWDRLLMGTTAESLARRLECDVLMIKPDSFMTELRRHLDVDALKRRYAKEQEALPA